ncbi:AAA family ATPase [Diplocloster agilis]|uniref:Cytidylate kinase-like family protein n=1 Tax=Diplocloster agilis TaxID=2850323 RepID=A0A949NC24_9FIRM|nr:MULTISPECIES: cytidylate kinase-like family protein [Lachnospiraceae]MBU9738197.1 cytidylate kinase-like family protein [Diplocloster agilis]MBU9743698.1 cytidylate kinase-like family protein [Diplocloster agilis]MCU6736382.1 cytidylate kinase-like family protein [Suonthocola fibrivorans]SCJ89892.1 cytidylate kinase [uncultured Clostridium sp.]
MSHMIIAIARQYGSGGKTIGHMLAKDLGIPCYDREIMKMASEDSGISEQLFAQADEKLRNSQLFKMASTVYKGELIGPESDEFVSNDNLFNYQAKILKELAQTEDFVVIGRAADFVLRDEPRLTRVFVHAPHDYCMARAMERNSMTEKEMERFIQKTDKHRAEYYKYYTGSEWEDVNNYDLCLNSSRLGFEGCVEAIKSYIQIRDKYGDESGICSY